MRGKLAAGTWLAVMSSVGAQLKARSNARTVGLAGSMLTIMFYSFPQVFGPASQISLVASSHEHQTSLRHQLKLFGHGINANLWNGYSTCIGDSTSSDLLANCDLGSKRGHKMCNLILIGVMARTTALEERWADFLSTSSAARINEM